MANLWNIEGTDVGDLLEERRNWQELSLKFRVDKPTLTNTLRPLNSDSGKVEVLIDSDGGFNAEGRASGSNSYTIKAPSARNGVRYIESWFVTNFTEQVIDQAGIRYEVGLDLVADSNKTPQTSYGSKTRASDEWKFAFDAGDVVTKRVNHEIVAEAKTGAEGKTLRMILEPEQVRVLEESLRHLDAVNILEVPDGENLAEDNSPNNVNTVTVTSPDGKSSVFADGDYVASTWETRWLNESFYEVEVAFVQK
jgi:hypothetical protein